MYHIFICSPVNGHLGCFYILANANGAAMNTEVHVSFQIRVFYKYMPRSAYICPGIAGSYGNSLFFKKTPYFFPQWLYWFAAPTTAQEEGTGTLRHLSGMGRGGRLAPGNTLHSAKSDFTLGCKGDPQWWRAVRSSVWVRKGVFIWAMVVWHCVSSFTYQWKRH